MNLGQEGHHPGWQRHPGPGAHASPASGRPRSLARAGYGAHHIKKALRHKQLQTSEHYVMLGQDALVDGLSALKKKARGE